MCQRLIEMPSGSGSFTRTISFLLSRCVEEEKWRELRVKGEKGLNRPIL